MIWLLDISNHQGNFDVAQAAREGFSCCLCKATEGATFHDCTFDRNIPLIRETGMIPGAYHFLRGGDGTAQARVFHDRIAAHGGPSGWLCACDNEADAPWATTVAFFAEWKRLTAGHPLIMYSGAWWWQRRGWHGASLTPYLWHSRYVEGVDGASQLYSRVPSSWWEPGYGGWGSATILQFSSSALVAGQPVDVSAFKGALNDLRRLTGAATGGDSMVSLIRLSDSRSVLLTDGVTSRWIGSEEELSDIRTLGAEGTLQLAGNGQVRVVTRRELLGRIIGPCPSELVDLAAEPKVPVALTPEDRTAIAGDVASLLAPQLRAAAQLADRLGAAGDALSSLNDPVPD